VIAERVGLSRGAFYVHFAGKDEVLSELALIEELRVAVEAQPSPEASLAEVFGAVVDGVLRAERRLGRRLVSELCAAQFRPEFAAQHRASGHPLVRMLVDAISERAPDVDAADLATTFMTAVFGLLATDAGPQRERRRRIDLLVQLLSRGATAT
jgi:AcrR family transcriptional regulator